MQQENKISKTWKSLQIEKIALREAKKEINKMNNIEGKMILN